MVGRIFRSHRLWLTAFGIALAFLLFEVGIRFVPPNGMIYVETDPSGRVIVSYSNSNPAIVAG